MEGNSNTPTLKEKETCETKKYLRQDELDEKFYQSIRDLMEAEVAAVSGLTYIQKFVTPEEQAFIVKELYGTLNENWESDNKRRVQQFSYSDGYMDVKNKPPPIPEILFPIMKKLVDAGFFPKLPDQVIINEYVPGENRELRMELIRAGQGIGKHVDRTHCFDEPVASVSLLSGAIMEFRHRRKESLTAKARYLWTHAIPARETDEVLDNEIKRETRISLTFRIMKEDFVEIQRAKQQQKLNE